MQTEIKAATSIETLRPSPPEVRGVGEVPKPGAQQKTVAEKPQPGTVRSEPSRDDIEAAVKSLSDYAQRIDRNLNFSIDEASGRTVIKVIDAETDRVVRQIPSEETLSMARRLEEGGGPVLIESET